MLRTVLSILFSFTVAASAAADTAPPVAVSIIPTAKLNVREGLVYSGGSFGKEVVSIFSAILVRHGEDLILFDSGLGSKVDQQYAQDMPYWQRPFFKYDGPVNPARAQLDKAGLGPVKKIFLSHSHWDHASGIGDFPNAEVWVSSPEMGYILKGASGVGAPWPSQVGSPSIVWRTLSMQAKPYMGFVDSTDVYGDGSIVLVPMYGHTPGSVGMFVTVESGQRYFFSGDVTWHLDAFKLEKPKFWAARALVDHDVEMTAQAVAQVHSMMAADPKLIVVPAHDGAVQEALGTFPHWLK